MASIKISELRTADSESFLSELSESRELAHVVGGGTRIKINVYYGGLVIIYT